LAQLGLTKDEFKLYDLDHIIPKSQVGPDHPCNLLVMPRLHNQQYGNRLPTAKVLEVGYRAMLQATCFYLLVHKLDDHLLGPLKLAAAQTWASCSGGIECRFLSSLSLSRGMLSRTFKLWSPEAVESLAVQSDYVSWVTP
jgi:hypothetical protein